MEYLIIGAFVVLIIGFVLTRIARETYNKPRSHRIMWFIGLWVATTFIGAIYYGIAVLVYRSNRGIEPSPAVEVEPVAWATR